MGPKDVNGIANSIDSNQSGAVWFASALFVKTCLFENLESLWYLTYFGSIICATSRENLSSGFATT